MLSFCAQMGHASSQVCVSDASRCAPVEQRDGTGMGGEGGGIYEDTYSCSVKPGFYVTHTASIAALCAQQNINKTHTNTPTHTPAPDTAGIASPSAAAVLRRRRNLEHECTAHRSARLVSTRRKGRSYRCGTLPSSSPGVEHSTGLTEHSNGLIIDPRVRSMNTYPRLPRYREHLLVFVSSFLSPPLILFSSLLFSLFNLRISSRPFFSRPSFRTFGRFFFPHPSHS